MVVFFLHMKALCLIPDTNKLCEKLEPKIKQFNIHLDTMVCLMKICILVSSLSYIL